MPLVMRDANIYVIPKDCTGHVIEVHFLLNYALTSFTTYLPAVDTQRRCEDGNRAPCSVSGG
jgi:hypothetical protein